MLVLHYTAWARRSWTLTGTLCVIVRGSFPRQPRWLPGFYLPFAIARSLLLALSLLIDWAVAGGRRRHDVLVVDQLSVSIPLLRMTGAKVCVCVCVRR